MTKDRGILMLVDSAQGAGHIALDMRKLDPDFYSFSGAEVASGAVGNGRVVRAAGHGAAVEAGAGVEPVDVVP